MVELVFNYPGIGNLLNKQRGILFQDVCVRINGTMEQFEISPSAMLSRKGIESLVEVS